MAGLGLKSEIIGIFRNFQKFYYHFVNRQISENSNYLGTKSESDLI